jgi:hypothetical protein
MRDNRLKSLAKCLFFRTGSVRRVAFGPLRGMRYRVSEITGLSPWYSGADREHQTAFQALVGKGTLRSTEGVWGTILGRPAVKADAQRPVSHTAVDLNRGP